MKTYKVWIQVEELGENGEHIQDIDLDFCESAEFDTEAKAIDFANALHKVAEIITSVNQPFIP